MLVRIITLLEGLRGQTSVIPFLARRRDVALYTTDRTWHVPFSGQFSLTWQLHGLPPA